MSESQSESSQYSDEQEINDQSDSESSDEGIILPEDKQIYPDIIETHPDAEHVYQDMDTQSFSTPLVQPVVQKKFDLRDESSRFDVSYILDMFAGVPGCVRSVAMIGAMHSGKTTLVQQWIQQNYGKVKIPERYVDARSDEQKRKVSILPSPVTLLVPDSKGKSWVLNVMDTPGHPDFSNELWRVLPICDGVIFIVDVIDGLSMTAESYLSYAVEHNFPIVVFLNKLDRLALELKLPPNDAYHKIRYVIQQISKVMTKYGRSALKPDDVIFGSTLYNFAFTLSSFSEIYSELYQVKPEAFASKLWGNQYFSHSEHRFYKNPGQAHNSHRSFVEFVLQPLYKLICCTVSYERDKLEHVLAQFGLYLKKQHYNKNASDLLRIVLGNFCSQMTALVTKISQSFSPLSRKSQPSENLNVNIVKMYRSQDWLTEYGFGRVLAGTVQPGDMVTINDENGARQGYISDIWLSQARWRESLEQALPGMWVMVDCEELTGPCILSSSQEAIVYKPICQLLNRSMIRVAIEPLNESDLRDLTNNISATQKIFPDLHYAKEDTDELYVLGTGEIFLDTVLHDIRNCYQPVEIRVAQPSVILAESVFERSNVICRGENDNGWVEIIAEPLEAEIWSDIENGRLDISDDFEERYNWDILAASSVWAFGPRSALSNLLVNDVLDDSSNLQECKDSIIKGMQWAVEEGPLCAEPILHVKFRLVGFQVKNTAPGLIIPIIRQAIYQAVLTGQPQILEPYYKVDIQCIIDNKSRIQSILTTRRGYLTSEEPIYGTPLYTITATVPIIECLGLETDIRLATRGSAFPQMIFSHWAAVPGNPLDQRVKIKMLEANAIPCLGREFLIKTRRRKGLLDDVPIIKYFTSTYMREMVEDDEDLKPYFNI